MTDLQTRARHARIDDMAYQVKQKIDLAVVDAAIQLGIPLNKINHNIPGMPNKAWLVLNKG